MNGAESLYGKKFTLILQKWYKSTLHEKSQFDLQKEKKQVITWNENKQHVNSAPLPLYWFKLSNKVCVFDLVNKEDNLEYSASI